MAPEPCCPILDNTATDVLTSKEAIVWQLLQFMFRNPGDVSNVFPGQLLSFATLAAKYGNDPAEIALQLEHSLALAILDYWSGDGIRIEVSYTPHNETGYKLLISIRNTDDTPILHASSVIEDGNSIGINYALIRDEV